jgi:hypothetical protein
LVKSRHLVARNSLREIVVVLEAESLRLGEAELGQVLKRASAGVVEVRCDCSPDAVDATELGDDLVPLGRESELAMSA